MVASLIQITDIKKPGYLLRDEVELLGVSKWETSLGYVWRGF